MLGLLIAAIAILALLLLLAFLVGRLFQSKKIRKRILWGSLTIYVLACIAYFGFIAFVMSGNLN
jgi:hypothetical protein